MNALVLPFVADVPHFDFQAELEGATYTLELRWNERSSTWSLSIYGAAGETLAAGRSVVLGADLLGRSRKAGLPPGSLHVVDTSGKGLEAGRSDLGTRVQLVYVESSGA